MNGFFVLSMIFLWGVLLGLGVHCWRSVPLRNPLLMVVCGAFGALCFFIATAVFLFYCNHGQTGLYGFPVMAAGFLLYRHCLEHHMARIFRKPLHWLGRCFAMLFHLLGTILRFFLSPLFWALKIGEGFWTLLGKPYDHMIKSHHQRKEKRMEEREKKRALKEEKRALKAAKRKQRGMEGGTPWE
ncbi:MAG: hypothetical protein U0M15_03735 [Bacillota bacterium]|nr:hypothetical protein [Bacillota bacterium]